MSVSDDGQGLPSTEVEHVFFGERPRVHALVLLRRRLQGLFGRSFQLEVGSEIGEGTRVRMRIPLRKRFEAGLEAPRANQENRIALHCALSASPETGRARSRHCTGRSIVRLLNSGGTDHVWFYDAEADGWSLDDKRNALLPDAKLGPVPSEPLTEEEHVKNSLPDILVRWKKRDDAERKRPRTAQSFSVSKAEIAGQGHDLSLNRYKEVVHEDVDHIPPKQIIAELKALEGEIQQGLADLEGMVV
jgi:hypothetical protein